MVRAGASLRRADRIRSPRDFRRVARRSRRVVSRNFVVLAARVQDGSPNAGPRLGITVTRRIGKAVVRNHVKRCVREAFRRERFAIPEGTDVVVIARGGAALLSSSEVARELRSLFESLSR